MNASPSRLPSRTLPPPPPDPASIRLPDSPDKTASLRRLKSHSQLNANAPPLRTQRSRGNLARPSKEQLKAPPPPLPPVLNPMPTRTRANSDAPKPFDRTRKPLTTITNTPIHASHSRKSSLEVTLRDGPPSGTSPSSALSLLRHSVLTSRVEATKEGMSDYRVYLWLTLLNVDPFPTDTYLSLIHRGRSPSYEKIKNDVFRTLATDTLFKRRVTDASLTRVLNATAWRIHDQIHPETTPTTPLPPYLAAQSPYVQGLNVLSAPLLYASRSEAQAYALVTTLLNFHVPTYMSTTMSGVHAGVDLIDRILAIINPTLSAFLLSHSLPAKIYAFPSVLTLCACTPPLPEVLRLWDFLFAFGTHLNVLCIVAQLLLLKDKLLESTSPAKLLRSFPQLDSEKVIKMTLLIVRELPPDVYEEVVWHGRR